MGNQKRIKNLTWVRPLMIVAMLGGAFMIYQNLNYKWRDFYAEVFVPPSISAEMEQKHFSAAQAIEAFRKGDYQVALAAFNQNENELNSSAELLLLKGVCQLEIGEYWPAIDYFEEVRKADPSLLQQAEWYKILSLIKLERKEEALKLLKYYCEQTDFDFMRDEALMLLEEY